MHQNECQPTTLQNQDGEPETGIACHSDELFRKAMELHEQKAASAAKERRDLQIALSEA